MSNLTVVRVNEFLNPPKVKIVMFNDGVQDYSKVIKADHPVYDELVVGNTVKGLMINIKEKEKV